MRAMPIRDFLRGGYQDIREPVIITKHGRPLGTWLPPSVSYMIVDTTIGVGSTKNPNNTRHADKISSR